MQNSVAVTSRESAVAQGSGTRQRGGGGVEEVPQGSRAFQRACREVPQLNRADSRAVRREDAEADVLGCASRLQPSLGECEQPSDSVSS